MTTSHSCGPVRFRSRRVWTRRVTSSISTGPFSPSRTVTRVHLSGARAWRQALTKCQGAFGRRPRPWYAGNGASRSRMMVLQGKPRQSLLYEFGELSGPYPLYSSLLSNHAAQQQKETLMLKKRGMDM